MGLKQSLSSICVIYKRTIGNTRRHLSTPSKLDLTWFLMKGLLLQEIALTRLFFQQSIFLFVCFFLKTNFLAFWHLLYLLGQGMTNVNVTTVRALELTLWSGETPGICHARGWEGLAEKELMDRGGSMFKTRAHCDLSCWVWDFEDSERQMWYWTP